MRKFRESFHYHRWSTRRTFPEDLCAEILDLGIRRIDFPPRVSNKISKKSNRKDKSVEDKENVRWSTSREKSKSFLDFQATSLFVRRNRWNSNSPRSSRRIVSNWKSAKNFRWKTFRSTEKFRPKATEKFDRLRQRRFYHWEQFARSFLLNSEFRRTSNNKSFDFSSRRFLSEKSREKFSSVPTTSRKFLAKIRFARFPSGFSPNAVRDKFRKIDRLSSKVRRWKRKEKVSTFLPKTKFPLTLNQIQLRAFSLFLWKRKSKFSFGRNPFCQKIEQLFFPLINAERKTFLGSFDVARICFYSRSRFVIVLAFIDRLTYFPQ